MDKKKMSHLARRDVLEALREMAMEKMSHGLKDGLKKVSVIFRLLFLFPVHNIIKIRGICV